MRYVSTMPPVATGLKTSLVQGLTAIHAIKPLRLDGSGVTHVEQHAVREGLRSRDQEGRGLDPSKDRRKVCRRVGQQYVLIELRSEIDRRRHNLFGTDPVEHIDEEA